MSARNPAQRKLHYRYEEKSDGESDECKSPVQTGYMIRDRRGPESPTDDRYDPEKKKRC